jgi:hypothetical protein
MKKLTVLLIACFAAICLAQDKIPAIITTPGELDAIKGHVQGACCSDNAIYLSHAGGIFKLDWSGKVLKHTELPQHTGDICYYKGRIYDSLSNPQGFNLMVLDEDLNVVGKYKFPGGDGATVLNDVLYIGTGPCPSQPHRYSNLSTFDLNRINQAENEQPKDGTAIDLRNTFLSKMTLDYGSETNYGVQDFANDGKYVYAMFYAANGGDPCVILTPDLKVVRTVHFDASTGFDFLPPSRNKSSNPRFFRVRHIGEWRKQNAKTQPAQVRIEFFEIVDGNFINITEN